MARLRRGGGNGGARLATQQSVNGAVKSICNIMRRSNCAGALQYVPELTWILFLRILDEREAREGEAAEAVGADFTPSLEPPYRWGDWAAPGGKVRAFRRPKPSAENGMRISAWPRSRLNSTTWGTRPGRAARMVCQP